MLFLLSGHLLCATGCDVILHNFTYRPHSKKQQQEAKPSIVLLERIIQFRENYQQWPNSKEDFMSRDRKYKEAFTGFKYLYTEFKIIDSDRMIFYFLQNVKDEDKYNSSGKIDLNRYGGEVKFYKEGGKLIWKMKMY
jgi:hypothetical protein